MLYTLQGSIQNVLARSAYSWIFSIFNFGLCLIDKWWALLFIRLQLYFILKVKYPLKWYNFYYKFYERIKIIIRKKILYQNYFFLLLQLWEDVVVNKEEENFSQNNQSFITWHHLCVFIVVWQKNLADKDILRRRRKLDCYRI